MTVCMAENYNPVVFYGDLDLTELPLILEFGYKLGNGVTIYDELESLLRDGTLVSSTKTGNRALVLSVLVKSTTGSQALADGGVLLDQECNRQSNTVTVYPGDYGQPGAGPALVLDTFVAQSDHEVDGDLEKAGYRRFILTIPALPGVRSVGESTINWTGPMKVLKPVTSVTGWAVSSGTRSSVNEGGGFFSITATANPVTFTVAAPDFPLEDFLWIRTNFDPFTGGVDDVAPLSLTVDGVAIPDVEVFNVGLGVSDKRYLLMADVSAWRGQTVPITFRVEAPATPKVYGFATSSYPNLPVAAENIPTFMGAPTPNGTTRGPAVPNFGIGVIFPGGTARTGARISFTAPAGGAFVFTSRDPVHALRERGLSEIVFGEFTWAVEDDVTVGGGVMWFPPGTHYTQIGRTAPQPPVLFPDGVWPQAGSGVGTIGTDTAATRWAYPADELAAVTFFNTTGAKNVISAGPDLRDGYQGDSVVFEEHQLHPDGTGFAVTDINGAPIAATVTYFKRWRHHPAEAS